MRPCGEFPIFFLAHFCAIGRWRVASHLYSLFQFIPGKKIKLAILMFLTQVQVRFRVALCFPALLIMFGLYSSNFCEHTIIIMIVFGFCLEL